MKLYSSAQGSDAEESSEDDEDGREDTEEERQLKGESCKSWEGKSEKWKSNVGWGSGAGRGGARRDGDGMRGEGRVSRVWDGATYK